MNCGSNNAGSSIPVPSLISFLTSSGTAGSVAKAMATCRKSLLGFIDDEAARAMLAERLESAPAAALLLARLLDGSPLPDTSDAALAGLAHGLARWRS
jgi:hypothetical protein